MGELSREQLAGQRLMVGFHGRKLSDDVRYLIDTLHVGGLILFSRNIDYPEQITRLCADIQQYAQQCGRPPLLIAIDQEGGQVKRLKPPFTQFPGNPAMTGVSDAIEFARVTAGELEQIGFNMNMAPVLDVAPRDINSVMAGRAFGGDPEWVAEMGEHMIREFQQHRIMAVAKHFPGIGRTTLDSHDDLPVFDADSDSLMAFDIKPFERAVTCQVAGMMLSHIRYSAIDPDWPASLSPAIVQGWLRDRLGYKGIVLTDDLDMGAITKHFDIRTVIRQIVAADIDVALICHHRKHMETALETLLAAFDESPEMQRRMQRSTGRILKLKADYLDFDLATAIGIRE
ncbi:MAG: beta-N-acetylhexosaminidase [Deltaproteobacteria bacterium]|nr:beta-N-acetylhexosaminidase [Deltaproteobacteria bacterium]